MLIATSILLLAACAAQAALTQVEADRIADAIYHIEGGSRTRYPYGVKAVRTRNPRAVCVRTIQNAHDDWVRYGRPHGWPEFLPYLAWRYCPPEADPVGNRRWLANIRSRLR